MVCIPYACKLINTVMRKCDYWINDDLFINVTVNENCRRWLPFQSEADTGPLRTRPYPQQPGHLSPLPRWGLSKIKPIFSQFLSDVSRKSKTIIFPFSNKHQYKIKKNQFNTLESDLEETGKGLRFTIGFLEPPGNCSEPPFQTSQHPE